MLLTCPLYLYCHARMKLTIECWILWARFLLRYKARGVCVRPGIQFIALLPRINWTLLLLQSYLCQRQFKYVNNHPSFAFALHGFFVNLNIIEILRSWVIGKVDVTRCDFFTNLQNKLQDAQAEKLTSWQIDQLIDWDNDMISRSELAFATRPGLWKLLLQRNASQKSFIVSNQR